MRVAVLPYLKDFAVDVMGVLLPFGEQKSTGWMALRRTGVVAVVRCGVWAERILPSMGADDGREREAPECVVRLFGEFLRVRITCTIVVYLDSVAEGVHIAGWYGQEGVRSTCRHP